MKKTTQKKTKKHSNDVANDPLVKRAIETISRVLAAASKKDLLSKYEVGEKVEEVRASAANEKYGKRVVATIARAVQLTPSRLYQFADVARTFDRLTFEDLHSRAATARLTFSHLHELAHQDHARHRLELLEEAIEKKMKVHELRARRGAGAKKAKRVDVLERLAAEGPTEAIRDAIEKEVLALHHRDKELSRRLRDLEAARAAWVTVAPSNERGTDLGKAAE